MNVKLTLHIFIGILLSYSSIFAQYNGDYVDISQVVLAGDKFSFIKMSRKNGLIKAKYFAYKDSYGASVYTRFREWEINKKIILFSSGTYLDLCDAEIARPEGICIDEGKVVNRSIMTNKDGLVIFYPTGGIAVSDIKNDLLKISSSNGTKQIDIRKPQDRIDFISWATSEKATAFQTHLLYYKNNLTIYTNSSPLRAPRRFLCVARENEEIFHYIVYLATNTTLYDATVKVSNFLKSYEQIQDLVYVINLDTGCQNVFELRQPNGKIDTRTEFTGSLPITKAANLIVYYQD